MHYNITTKIDVCVNDSGFSLDELVYRMSILHKGNAFPVLLAEVLMMYDGYVRLDVMQCNCIPLTCSCGSNMYVPVIEICGLDLYQTKTTGVCVSHSTSHRWVLRSDADEISVPEDVIATVKSGDPAAKPPEPVTIFADGTFCKGRDADGHAMFNHLRRWLALGIVCPRASSLIERTMRELARRLKRIAYGWKEEGLSKISKFILKIFSNEEEWRKYWEQRMAINQNVLLNFKMIKPASVDK